MDFEIINALDWETVSKLYEELNEEDVNSFDEISSIYVRCRNGTKTTINNEFCRHDYKCGYVTSFTYFTTFGCGSVTIKTSYDWHTCGSAGTYDCRQL